MSLNRAEQMTYDYVQANVEEQRYWHEKVRAVAQRARDQHTAATELEEALWRYYEERSGVVSPFRDVALREGLRRISLRNLSEYLLRVWTPPQTKKKPAGGALAEPYA
jgi:hypothetical protein